MRRGEAHVGLLSLLGERRKTKYRLLHNNSPLLYLRESKKQKKTTQTQKMYLEFLISGLRSMYVMLNVSENCALG